MLKRKPYFLLFAIVILFLILGFFVDNKSILDLNVHDTYYIIAHNHLYWLLTIIMFLLLIVYCFLNKLKVNLVVILSKIHIYGTLVSIIGMFFPYSLILKPSNFPLYDDMQNVNLCVSISGLLFLLLQLLFIINIFVAIIKKFCNSAAQ